MTPPFTVQIKMHHSVYPQICPTLREAVRCAYYTGEEVDCWVAAICDATGAVIYRHTVEQWVAVDPTAPPFPVLLADGAT